MQGEPAAIAAKTVGEHDVGPGVDEGLMQRPDPVGMDGVPNFRGFAGGEAHGEQVGAGGAVRQQRPALGQKGLQHGGLIMRRRRESRLN